MNEKLTNGPLPSKHVFLHELAKLPTGSKVRFLGCVVDYEVYTGSLFLEHNIRVHVLPTPQVSVDVRLVLESIKTLDLQRGSWLNIIGYVRKSEQPQKKATNSMATDIGALPVVQAIIIWGAGAINVADYEAALISQREMKTNVDFYTAS